MSVRFVLGRVGTGKSQHLFSQIKQELLAMPMGPPLILLVPEQMSQAADRMLAAIHSGTVRAQSLSFHRLAFRIMQECGGSARVHIDDTGRKMLLYKFAKSRLSELKVLRKITTATGWIEAVHDWYAECRRYHIDSLTLRTWVDSQTQTQAIDFLSDKIADLALLAGDMEAAMATHYIDSEDYLQRLADLIPHSPSIGHAEIWIDGFHGFTPIEERVLAQLFRFAKKVHIALTIPHDQPMSDELDELELFHPTATTLQRLKKIATEMGVSIEPPFICNSHSASRYQRSPLLASLERAYVNRESQITFGERELVIPSTTAENINDVLKIISASHPRAEVEAVAREIIRTVVDGRARWRDLALFVRNWEGYGDLVEGVFHDHGIPYFVDQKKSIAHHPLSELVRSALEVVSTHWTYDAIFRAVKTDLLIPLGTFPDDAAQRFAMDQLENVVLAYGLIGTRWTNDQDWVIAPQVSLEQDETERKQSEPLQREATQMNQWRSLVATPLRALERALHQAVTIKDQAEALYLFLQQTGSYQRLERWREQAQLLGHLEQAREHEQVWTRLIDLLDQLVELVGHEPADLELFTGMVATGLDGIRIGLVPPSIDQVLVGDVDRTRSFGVKYLFMLGVNEGVIPMKPREQSLITEVERERLQEQGIMLAPDSRRRLLDERFLIYNAWFLPSDGLWISYTIADAEGKSSLPSEWIAILKSWVPGISITSVAHETSLQADDPMILERLTRPGRAISDLLPQLRSWQRGETISSIWFTIYNWLWDRPYWRAKLEELTPALFYRHEQKRLSEETALALVGEMIRTSVSRLEKFASCPFAHFALYSLKLKERKEYRLQSPDIGQLYHAALSLIAKKLLEQGKSWRDLAEVEAYEMAYSIIDQLSPRLLSSILLSSNRHRYVATKLKQIVGHTVATLVKQARRSAYQQFAAEIDFRRDGTLPPLTLPLTNGKTLELSGQIDRIDYVRGQDHHYVRVIDYKSREHRLELNKIYYGLQLQLLAYTDVAVQHAPTWLGVSAQAAGAFYFHVHRPMLLKSNAGLPVEIAENVFKEFKMRGLLLDEEESARLMDVELEQGKSPIVTLEWKKDGTLAKHSALIAQDRWESLQHFVRDKLSQLGLEISQGNIKVSPYRRKKELACNYCQYKSVCQFEPELEGFAYRHLPPLSDEEIWRRIQLRQEGRS